MILEHSDIPVSHWYIKVKKQSSILYKTDFKCVNFVTVYLIKFFKSYLGCENFGLIRNLEVKLEIRNHERYSDESHPERNY